MNRFVVLAMAGVIACVMALAAGCSSDDSGEGASGNKGDEEQTAASGERNGADDGEAGDRGDDDSAESTGAEADSQDDPSAQPELSAEDRERIRQQRHQAARDRGLSPEEAGEAVAGIYEILGEGSGGGDGSGGDRSGGGDGEQGSMTLDLEAFCNLMSSEAIEQTIEYARVSSGIARDWDCQSATALLLRRSRGSGGLDRARAVEIVGVNVEGNRATATARFGRRGPLTTLPMVREDGEWKLAPR